MSRIPDAELPADLQTTMRNNLHRLLANNQTMADGFAALARLVHSASHLPHRVRELVILRIASLLKAEVEWAQHFKIAQMCGVTIDEARAIRDDDLSKFPDAERAAIALAEAVEQGRVGDAEWTAAVRHFTPVQLLDLVMVAGFYGYASRLTMAMDVEVDAGLTRIADA